MPLRERREEGLWGWVCELLVLAIILLQHPLRVVMGNNKLLITRSVLKVYECHL